MMPDDNDLPFGLYEASCAGCDGFARVNDLGLCEDCAGKLERDLIRQRDWDYSAAAYGLKDEQREQLHRQVIRQFGAEFELIAAPKKPDAKRKRKNRKAHRHH